MTAPFSKERRRPIVRVVVTGRPGRLPRRQPVGGRNGNARVRYPGSVLLHRFPPSSPA